MAKYVFDSLIIGSGGSALALAFYLLKQNPNHKICIATSGEVTNNNNTVLAQGGICGVDEELTPEDDIEYHIYDTIKGGDWLGDHDSIELMAKNSGSVIKDLISIGVDFDRDSGGNLLRKKYGGHTKNFGDCLSARVFSCKDMTGKHIHEALLSEVNGRVDVFENYFALSLIFDEYENNNCKDNENNSKNKKRRCVGCVFLNKDGDIQEIFAKNTVICTGGYSSIFKTSTSETSIGSGNLFVASSGITLQDMEFVQFHPTGFLNGKLISEAARAIGARLLNAKHERFMVKYAPNTLELASRDVISRAIVSEMQKCGSDFVFLDLRHIDTEEIKQKLPYFYENCNLLSLNPSKDLIPVRPSAHYSMGGIPTNKFGQVVDFCCGENYYCVETLIQGLYAIGEAACSSVHGANRLGCNSILELLTSAKVIAEKIIEEDCTKSDFKIPEYEYNIDFTDIDEVFALEIKNKIRLINGKYAGIIRNEESLKLGLEKIKEIQNLIDSFENQKINQKSDKKINRNKIINYFEIKAMIVSSLALYYSAIERRESRGAHYRVDYNEKDDKYRFHSIFSNINNQYLKRILRKIDYYENKFPVSKRLY